MNSPTPQLQAPKRYLCIDTCVLVGCCLLETERDTGIEKALETLREKLDAGDLVLLVPEVVIIEFPKVLRKRLGEMGKIAETLASEVGKEKGPNSFKPKVTGEIQEFIREVVTKRAENAERVRGIVQTLFSHPSTRVLPITTDSLLEAFKLSLAGEKPSKEKSPTLQGDCVIVTLLQSWLQDKDNYELYLCSSNTADFSETGEVSSTRIHPDIAKRFEQIEYHTNLLDLLNRKFGTSYPETLAEKLTEESLPADLEAPTERGQTGAAESMPALVMAAGPETAKEV